MATKVFYGNKQRNLIAITRRLIVDYVNFSITTIGKGQSLYVHDDDAHYLQSGPRKQVK